MEINKNIIGQWIGNFSGTSSGNIILNLELRDEYVGRMIVFQNDTQHGYIIRVKLSINLNSIDGELKDFQLFDRSSRQFLSKDDFLKNNPDVPLPSNGSIKGQLDYKKMTGDWSTDIGTFGKFELEISDIIDERSSRNGFVKDWDNFKKYISTLKNNRYIFRGQSVSNKLSTSFHRLGRSDLFRYIEEDIPVLHRYFSSLPGHFFDL